MMQTHSIESFAKDLTIFFSAAILAISACTNLWMTGWQSGSATFYGVRVDPQFENSYEATEIDSAYTRQVIWLTVALFALIFAVVSFIPIYRFPRVTPFGITGLILVHVLGMQILYWRARQKVLSFAAPLGSIRTVDLATFVTLSREWKIVYWAAVLMPFGLLALTALYLRANFSLIPLSLALPNPMGAIPKLAWTKSAVYGVYKPLVQGAFVNLTSVLAAYAFNYRSRISEWGAEVRSRWTYRKVLMSRLAVMQWLITVQCMLRALFPLAETKALPVASERFIVARLLWTVAYSIVFLVFLFKLYRSRPVGAADTAPDRSWKLGQYYINPRDPALIVPTRFGVGHTLNLGQPMAWTIPVVGALGLISIWIGPNYISQRSTQQSNLRRTRPSLFRVGGIPNPTDRGALMEAVTRLKQGDAGAAQTIRELAKQHQGDEQFLNTAAYELALLNKELPSARQYAERAVSMKEGQLRNLELGYLKLGDVYRLRDLAMFWDTLGWVCYRQREMDCAHRYLLAAWTLNRRAFFGSHLAQVAAEQGNVAEATTDYEQALGAPGQPAEKQEIEYRLDALANTRQRAIQHYKEIPLEHMVQRSDVFYVDLLFQNGSTDGKQELPKVGNESNLTGPALNEREKMSVAKSLTWFPFPDAGLERIIVRVRVTCLKESKATCSMLPYTPDQIRHELDRPGALAH